MLERTDRGCVLAEPSRYVSHLDRKPQATFRAFPLSTAGSGIQLFCPSFCYHGDEMP